MIDRIAVIDAFIAAWAALDIDALMALFAEDAVFENIPMEPIAGKPRIRAALGQFIAMVDGAPWELIRVAETREGTVLTERADIFVKDGKRLTCPVMGAFEIGEDGLITHWRDYFDLADWNRQLGADPDMGRRAGAVAAG